MKNYVKRMLSLLLVTILCVSTLSLDAGAADNILSGTLTGKRDFIWPVPGNYNVMSCYLDQDAIYVTHERDSEHYALDISAALGTDVVASYQGEVIKVVDGGSGHYGDGFGNYVVIKHEGYLLNSGEKCTLYSRYSHLNSVAVKEHTTVSAGTVIGQVGQSGFAYGPHLDFQILQNDWSNRASNGLDPYANDLLELPSNITKTANTDCCQEYIEAITTKYATPLLPEGVFHTKLKLQIAPTVSDTALSVPFFNFWAQKKQTKSTSVWTRSGPGKSYDSVTKYTMGDTLTAIGYTKNDYGNVWYYLEDGTYIYAGNVTIQTCLSTASISGVSAPSDSLPYGSIYILTGRVVSGGNQLVKIVATIKDANGNTVLTESDQLLNNFYSLQNSKLDSAMAFNKLERGNYTFEISVEESVEDGKKCVSIQTVLYSSNFNVS